VSNISFGIVRKGSRNICCIGRCCLNNNSLGPGIPMGINCVPFLFYNGFDMLLISYLTKLVIVISYH